MFKLPRIANECLPTDQACYRQAGSAGPHLELVEGGDAGRQLGDAIVAGEGEVGDVDQV